MIKRLPLLISLALYLSFPASAIELKFNTQDFPPFNYLSNGVVSGPASDIIRTICQEINVACSFKLGPWKKAQEEVKEGKAHAMFVIGWNRGRANWLYFSPQIMTTEYGFFVAKGNPLKYTGIKDLSSYNVGVFGPSNTAKSLEKLQKRMKKYKTMVAISIVTQPDDIAVFKNLNSPERTLTAVFSNRDVGNAIIRNEKLRNLRYAGEQRKLNYYIGFSKQYNDKKLVDRFNKAYIELYTTGRVADILQRYSMKPATIEPHIIAFYKNIK